ncbi:hypothetical protein C4580_01835 [Candidatus Woesearchaeota archaeon]|nr:MAG: hypothetical protein C4580_01835 [Candidatus Woesearchaeota archaeon]
MKFLIIGDLHGHKPNIYFKEFDAIIAPGDFCSDAPRAWMFKALKDQLASAKSKTTWYGLVGRKKAKRMVQKSLADGRAILEYLNSFGKPVYAVPGNWDWTGKESDWTFIKKNYWPRLIRDLNNVVDLHHKTAISNGITLLGHGIISGPEYPQDPAEKKRLTDSGELDSVKKSYIRQKSIVTRLFYDAKSPVIFIPHNVPYNTPLDQINNPASPRNGQHFGSVIAREMIYRFSPLVCIGGHMHEHFTHCKLGKTLCINAGFGPHVNVLLEIEGDTVKKVEFSKAGKIVETIS